MSVPLVSVIIPVRNGARYLHSCLQSVTRQSLRSLEIIIVDDASTDGSREIIDAFAESDARIHVLAHSRHRGVSIARNQGIERASGEYIIFLDSDDCWASECMLSELHDTARGHGADLVEFGFFRSDTAAPKAGSGAVRRVDLRTGTAWTVRYNAWAKLIPRALLMKHGIRFDPGLIMGEDALFAVSLYCHAATLVVVDTPYYCYRIHPDSANTGHWDRRKLFSTVEWFERAIDVLQHCEAFATRPGVLHSIADERLRSLLNRLGPMALQLLEDGALRDYIAIWSRCLSAVDPAHLEKTAAGDHAGLYRELLRTVRQIDSDAFRALFASQRYRRRNESTAGSVTLTQAQALQLGRSLLAADGENIRCDFGDGVVAMLPRGEAHQLARRLTENRNPSITLRFS